VAIGYFSTSYINAIMSIYKLLDARKIMPIENEPVAPKPEEGSSSPLDAPSLHEPSIQEYAQTNGVNSDGVVGDVRKAVEMAYESKLYHDGRAAIPEGERRLDKETAEKLGLARHPSLPPEWLDTDLENEARVAEERAARRVDKGEEALVQLGEDGSVLEPRQMADVEDYYRGKTAAAERDTVGRREGETEEAAQRRQMVANRKLGSLGKIKMEQRHFEGKAHLPEYGRTPLITPKDTPEVRKRKVDIAEEAAYAAKPGVEAAMRLNGSLDRAADNAPDVVVKVGVPLAISALFYGVGKGYGKLRKLWGLGKAEKVIRKAKKRELLDKDSTPVPDQTEEIQPLRTYDLQDIKPKQPPTM
jgi:hypothetical protein